MDYGLISELARADIAERVAAVERDRLAQSATRADRARPGRVSRAVTRLRTGLSEWRLRNQLGSVAVTPCAEECGGAP